MKLFVKMQEQGKGIVNTIWRFPVTVLFLLLTTIWGIMAISQEDFVAYNKFMISFVLGAAIFIVLQMIYERFFHNPTIRYIFMVIPFIFAGIYYLIIKNLQFDIKVSIRTIVLFFILLIAFIWVPVIKSRININQSFVAVFKAFFMAVLFSGLLFLGILLIIGATDMLILNVDDRAYAYAANIIFVLFFPIYFLSMIPAYPQEGFEESEDSRELLMKLVSPGRFLEVLISYVAIPIATVFTVILLLYILMNIRGDFWTNNLMEPLLVSYSIVVIIVYLLASTVTNTITKYFRVVFPKVLLLVVLFQTISSVLRIQEDGITYGRYYVIMFGVFAIIASTWFCIKPVQSNGIIAPVLIVLSILSILPFVNAFSVSKANQTSRLVNALDRNDMFDQDKITPRSDISKEDKETIISSVRYLSRMEYTKEINWLRDYYKNNNFEKSFGFPEYAVDDPAKESNYVSVVRKQATPISVAGYEFMTRLYIYDKNMDTVFGNYEVDGKKYTLSLVSSSKDQQDIMLKDGEQEVLRFPLNQLFSKYESENGSKELDTSELTFTEENEKAAITVVAESININIWKDEKSQQADITILVKLK
jgi:hypothetical protein